MYTYGYISQFIKLCAQIRTNLFIKYMSAKQGNLRGGGNGSLFHPCINTMEQRPYWWSSMKVKLLYFGFGAIIWRNLCALSLRVTHCAITITLFHTSKMAAATNSPFNFLGANQTDASDWSTLYFCYYILQVYKCKTCSKKVTKSKICECQFALPLKFVP